MFLENMTTRKTTPWSAEEVQTFLSLVADEKIQRELDGATRNEQVYQDVSEMLAAHGYQRSFQQCREKLKKIKSDYRSIKDHNGRSGSNRKTWKWFDQMDAIYGHRPMFLENMTTRKTTPWSAEEVQTFLSLVADEKIQRELDGVTRNEKVYQGVSEMLAAHGYQRSFQQCREKLKKLKSDYRSIKDHNCRSGSNRKTWKLFDQMDAIYGHRPASNEREISLDSASALLETLVEEDSISEQGDTMAQDDSPLVPSAASTPTPSASSTPQNQRKRRLEQDNLTVVREMQETDVEQQELNRAQRERHLQMALKDAACARELEAALRREENAETAAFNQAFLGTMGQLVQALSGRRDEIYPPLD